MHNVDMRTYHYGDVIMGTIASQITSLTIVYSTVYSRADQRKHQTSASLAFVRGIHRGPVNSPHKWPVTRKMFPFDDVIMILMECHSQCSISCVRREWKWITQQIGVYGALLCVLLVLEILCSITKPTCVLISRAWCVSVCLAVLCLCIIWVLEWLNIYMSNRYQVVKYNDYESEARKYCAESHKGLY